MRLTNPYTLEQTLSKLRKAIQADKDAVDLLDKALDKSKCDTFYAKQLEEAFLKGSTIECRQAFSPFGDYLETSRRDVEPFYPHRHAVNIIDTALYYVKAGFLDDDGGKREVPDLKDSVSLEISAAVAETLQDGIQDITPLFGVASGKVPLNALIDEKNCDRVFYTIYARDHEGFAKAIHDSDTLEQAQVVASFIKGCNYHLGISLN